MFVPGLAFLTTEAGLDKEGCPDVAHDRGGMFTGSLVGTATQLVVSALTGRVLSPVQQPHVWVPRRVTARPMVTQACHPASPGADAWTHAGLSAECTDIFVELWNVPGWARSHAGCCSCRRREAGAGRLGFGQRGRGFSRQQGLSVSLGGRRAGGNQDAVRGWEPSVEGREVGAPSRGLGPQVAL